jgi:hypothetical protein
MLEFMRHSDFDFTHKAVIGLSGRSLGPLVPAHEMRLTVIRGGLHVAGRSDGMSLLVLPQQFPHYLKPCDPNVNLIRADFLLTGMIFFRKCQHRHSVRLRHLFAGMPPMRSGRRQGPRYDRIGSFGAGAEHIDGA